MLEVNGRRFDNGEPICVRAEGGRIVHVVPAWPATRAEDWPIIAPGLFDLQINGHGGVWFSDEALTPEQVASAVLAYPRFGVTRLFPTLITNSFEALSQGFRAIRDACEENALVAKLVGGCHLEGPYISDADGPRGAHPKVHVRPADWDEFSRLQEASGDRIKLVTIAPECPGAIPFIERATQAGVTIAIGHTAATPEQVRAAVDAGARLSTHLGNGCHAMLHRHHNCVTEQLSDARLMASIIVDGHHVPPALVRTFLKVKGTRGIVLTCDAAGWAGCPPGLYDSPLGRSEILDDGKLVVAGQRELLAGSAYETDVCLTKVREFAGVSWREAVDMACRNPARLLGLEAPKLIRGALADFFLFRHAPGEPRLAIEATVVGGELVHGRLPMTMDSRS